MARTRSRSAQGAGSRTAAALCAGLTAAVLAACGGGAEERLVAGDPPAGWAERIAADRATKDGEFRSDPETPILAADLPSFRGLEYWPPDPAYRFSGPIFRYERPERFTILSTTGKPRPCERYGRIRFEVRGRECALQVFRLLDVEEAPGDPGFFLPFTDETTGRETYPSGRYVDIEGSPGGPYVVDFNRAYNPLCAYGAPERYVCPVTPAENRLRCRIEAGERGWRRHDGGTADGSGRQG